MPSSPDNTKRRDLARRLDELEGDIRRLRLDLGAVRVDACMALSRTNLTALSRPDRIDPDDPGDGLYPAALTDPELLQLVIEEQREYGRGVSILIGELAVETRAGFAAARANAEQIIAKLGGTS